MTVSSPDRGHQIIQIDGRIRGTSEPMVSSVTGLSAAVIHCKAGFDERATHAEGSASMRRVVLGAVDLSGDLIIAAAVGAIYVPQGSFSVDAREIDLQPLPAGGKLPTELEALAQRRLKLWLVAEHVLRVGDPVELRGTVRPTERPECAFEVVPITGTLLRDRSLDDMSEDLARMARGPANKGRLAVAALVIMLAVVVTALVSLAAGC